MKRPRLLVIDPSCNHAETEGVRRTLYETSPDSVVLEPSLKGEGPRPGDSYEWDGVVVLGSAISVYDSHAWLRDLSLWLQPLIDGEHKVPLLGICFGHQLLAHLAGGRVEFLTQDRKKLLGLRWSRFTDEGRLVPSGRYCVIASHREGVVEMPGSWRVTAEREGSPFDAIEHRERNLFGVQFHPEAAGEFLGSAGLDPLGFDEECDRTARLVLGGFRSLCSC